MSDLQAALTDLAALYEYGALRMATDPEALIRDVIADVRALVAERIRAEKAEFALSKINEIRDSIVGTQTVHWSALIYPPVAEGEEGMSEQPYKCPVCNGAGRITRPPGIGGDVETWTASGITLYCCPLCKGERIIWRGQPDAPIPDRGKYVTEPAPTAEPARSPCPDQSACSNDEPCDPDAVVDGVCMIPCDCAKEKP